MDVRLKIKRAHSALLVKSLPTRVCVCAEISSAKAFSAAPGVPAIVQKQNGVSSGQPL